MSVTPAGLPPPPPPPPPPPQLLALPPVPIELESPTAAPIVTIDRPIPVDPDVCTWAVDYPDLLLASARSGLCLHSPPFIYKYRQVRPIIQVGPTCGLVALSMLIDREVSPDEILNISKLQGYTCNGEMLSCKNMVKLTEKVLSLAEIPNVKYSLKVGNLFSNETVEKLLKGASLLVPYDADCNHSPCCRRGHTAHWALVCGVIVTDDPGDKLTATTDNVWVYARHGKSRYLTAWRLDALEKSNKNLQEFSPKKDADGLMYIMPEGGLGGENGLRNQYLIFEGF